MGTGSALAVGVLALLPRLRSSGSGACTPALHERWHGVRDLSRSRAGVHIFRRAIVLGVVLGLAAIVR